MSTDTDTQVDDDVLEGLDFEHVPACEMTYTAGAGRWMITFYRCRKSASWLGISRCCGGQTYACEKHRSRPVWADWFCSRCRIIVDAPGPVWRRL